MICSLLVAPNVAGKTCSMSYGLLILFTFFVCISTSVRHLGYVCHLCTRWTSQTVWRKWWYQLFSVMYVAPYLLLINSATMFVLLALDIYYPVMSLFLNCCPGVVEPILLLIRTRKWCRPTPFPIQVDPFSLMGGCKSWQSILILKLERMLCSCSTKALKGFSYSLITFHD